jgi:hypothetical protein
MKQSAAVRPEPTLQRKAAIAAGGVMDHAGSVQVEPIEDFDLNQTIFQTLEGTAARYVMKTRVGKEVHWSTDTAAVVQDRYRSLRDSGELPEVSTDLLRFMVEECDFDVEHADGSFLDHLYFGFEYTVQHYPQQSPLVMLLHSILGTGTNTFAMTAEKIPDLRALLSPQDWIHIEAFPSVLRLLYAGDLRTELRENRHRIDALETIHFHRVIDNEPIAMSGADLWVQLNYQLIHLIDFLPVANWSTHRNDTSFIIFRDLYDLMVSTEMLKAKLNYEPASGPRRLEGERQSLGGWLTTLIPVGLSESMAASSVRRFSERIGHDMTYRIDWR